MLRLIKIGLLNLCLFVSHFNVSAISKSECFYKPKDAVYQISDGYNKIYNLNRQIWFDGEFKNGKIVNGKEYVYLKNGLLDYIRIYENRRYVCDEFLETDFFRKLFNDVKEIHKKMIYFHWRNLTLVLWTINMRVKFLPLRS